MYRKIKALSVAAMVVFAFSAIAASSASADFMAEKDHVALSGSQVSQHTFTTTVGTVHCTTATFAGTINDADTTTDQITITPTYSGCVLTGFGINVNINMNGCDYLFTTSGQTHIVCPENKKITTSGPGCTLTIGPQTVSSSKFTNVGSGSGRDLTIDTAVTGIAYSHSGFLCGNGGGNLGTYNGVTTMSGKDSEGKPVGIWSNH